MAVKTHLAQANIALVKGPLDGPIMAVDEALLRATDWSGFAPCPEAKPGPSTSSPTLACGG
jgi:hypothetical protein